MVMNKVVSSLQDAVAGIADGATLLVSGFGPSGVPGYEVVSWFGLWAPAGTPSDIVDKINKAVVDILRTPQMVAQIRGWGAIPHPESPAEFDAFIRSEGKRWAGVVREANLKVE